MLCHNYQMTDTQAPKPTPLPPGQRGQGRKKLPATEKKEVVTLRLNEQRRAAFKALGGVKWLEPMIDAAFKKKLAKEKPTDNEKG